MSIDETISDFKFEYGDVCSWVITTPENMGFKDFLWLIVYDVSNAAVYVKNGKDYVYDGVPPSKVRSTGKKFGVLKGKEFYVIGISDSIFAGDFSM